MQRAARRASSIAFEEKIERLQGRRRAAAGRHQDGQGLRRHQAQAAGRRQDGRPPRQQGRAVAHPSRGGHAVPRRRHAGRHRAESARRSVAHERRPDSRDPSRVGGARARAASWPTRLRANGKAGVDSVRTQADASSTARRRASSSTSCSDDDVVQARAQGARAASTSASPVFDGADGGRDLRLLEARRAAGERPDARCSTAAPASRSRTTVTVGVMYMHEAAPPGRRQDPRPLDRPVLAGHAAAARRQGAVRRPASRRDGGVGARGVRRGLHAAGDADRQVRRRGRSHAHVRGDRQGRERARARPAGVVQRHGEGAAEPGAGRRAARRASRRQAPDARAETITDG